MTVSIVHAMLFKLLMVGVLHDRTLWLLYIEFSSIMMEGVQYGIF
jgi:hypothetical protein